jgi:hypothetical protein
VSSEQSLLECLRRWSSRAIYKTYREGGITPHDDSQRSAVFFGYYLWELKAKILVALPVLSMAMKMTAKYSDAVIIAQF